MKYELDCGHTVDNQADFICVEDKTFCYACYDHYKQNPEEAEREFPEEFSR